MYKSNNAFITPSTMKEMVGLTFVLVEFTNDNLGNFLLNIVPSFRTQAVNLNGEC